MTHDPSQSPLTRILGFCETAEAANVNGLDFQHAAICDRRCWLHIGASLNVWSDNVRLGEIRHAGAHARDKSAAILDGLRPDRLDWTEHLVIEQKSSKSHIEAAIDQAAFYAAMMTRATGSTWSVRLNINPSRRNVDFPVNGERLDRLEASLDKIKEMRRRDLIPDATRIGACTGYSNRFFCWLDGD